MAITKDKKRHIVAKLTDALKEATSVVFVRFNKLSVADASLMRKTLKGEGVQYYVAKKTLIRRALAQHKFSGEIPEMEGEIAVAWSKDDSTAPARLVYQHGKKLKGALAIAGGIFDGAFASVEKLTAIATIPALPILRGMFVNVINAPRQGFVIALNQIAQKKA